MTLVEIRRYKTTHWGPKGCSPQQLMKTNETRASTLHRVETTLERGRSFLLQTARWSGGREFCRDFCRIYPKAQYISMRFPSEFDTFEAWILFLSEWRRQCGLSQDEKLHVIAERKGFRWKLQELFSVIEDAENRIFLFDQIERWPMTIIEDVQRAWKEYSRSNKAPILVLAGAIQGGLFPNRIWLYDYSLEEARTLLCSALNRDLQEEEEHLLQLSGGIPDLVYTLCWGMKNQSFEQAWLSIRREIRSVIDLMSSRERLFERLYLLQKGAQSTEQELDIPLSQAGLIRMLLHDGRQISKLRAPLISEVLMPGPI